MAKGVTKDIQAFLGEETSFEGKLIFEGTVRIDGKFQGEIHTDDIVIVGESAEVNAEINAGEIIISGTVRGNIFAKESLEIMAPGKVYGNILTPKLMIQEGVIFEGTCRMEKLDVPMNAKVSVLNPEAMAQGQDKIGEP
ncbi:MAG: polymer-forming cytoskeletal protein [Deltaproteobacteria bacterium]|nr:polymer-forming cytoskeletal protein [Deltaproteobacteria bacterium]